MESIYEVDAAVGRICKVSLRRRGKGDNNVIFGLFADTDHDYENLLIDASAYWIDNLIETLQEAKKFLETDKRFAPDPDNWGFKFIE